MIIDLPGTSTSDIGRKLVTLRGDVGAMALGRVLTLVVVVDSEHLDVAMTAATDASRQHPSRIIALVPESRRGNPRLDAQIRVGGDAGASEVVIVHLYGGLADHGRSVALPLLLADSPVLAWWPHLAPADVARDPIGAMAQRRVTDAAAAEVPREALAQRAASYAPGDTDLAWTRITRWRGLLAAALEQPPFEPITSGVVAGAPDSPSTELLAGWLAYSLRAPMRIVKTAPGTGITSVRLERRSGPIDLVRPGDTVATLSQTGQPDRRISLARRTLPECLADELRHLDADEVYATVLRKGIDLVSHPETTQAEAIRVGEAPSPEESRKLARRITRRQRGAT